MSDIGTFSDIYEMLLLSGEHIIDVRKQSQDIYEIMLEVVVVVVVDKEVDKEVEEVNNKLVKEVNEGLVLV